ncbi:MAG: ATP-NAD kinase family protein [Nitrososphaeria archaeon]
MGFKGTDNKEIVKLALAKKVSPRAQIRASEFIEGVKNLSRNDVCFYTSGAKMGQDYLLNKGVRFKIAYEYSGEYSTSADTEDCCKKFLENGVEVIFFVGGDGTARNVYNVVQNTLPLIGIPAGVKMYSGVFCTTISASTKIFLDFLNGNYELGEEEIIDVDEESYRKDFFNLRIYGYALTLRSHTDMQGSKQESYSQDKENQERIAKYFIERMERNIYYILGPGTTVKSIPRLLNEPNTLLGVDILLNGKIIALDVNEEQIMQTVENNKAKVVVSPLGKQGIVFGRGNQQISSKIIKLVGKENLVFLATERKLMDMKRNYLIADLDDPEMREKLYGYVRVLIDYNTEKVMKLVC